MSIEHTFAVEGALLEVRASGVDEGLGEVEVYALAVIEAAVENRTRLDLCLESALEYRLGTSDTFMAASYVSEQAPHVAPVAVVRAPESLGVARFWEDVTRNRGLQAAVFNDEAEARRWLDAGRGAPASEP